MARIYAVHAQGAAGNALKRYKGHGDPTRHQENLEHLQRNVRRTSAQIVGIDRRIAKRFGY